MASPESIISLPTVSAKLLDRAAAEIRDSELAPVRGNVTRIGKALAEIFEIEETVYAAHPHLRPPERSAPDPHAESNRRLTAVMIEALDHEERGDVAQAMAAFEAYLDEEQTPHHRKIAQGEIDRLRRGCDG